MEDSKRQKLHETLKALAPKGKVGGLGFYAKAGHRSRRSAADGMPEAGPAYEGAGRSETFFGETGAQSSLVPALDAALGIGMSEDDLLPYLLAMRDYMPAEHAAFVRHLEAGPRLRDAVVAAGDGALVAA